MKTLSSIIYLIFPLSLIAQEYGKLVDPRDGFQYKTLKIGDQWWMAENLAYDAGEGCHVYDDRSIKMEREGRLYTWTAAMAEEEGESIQGVCPDGWHLPSRKEFYAMIEVVGGFEKAGKNLKTGGSSKMNVIIPGQRFKDGTFRIPRSETHYWSSTDTGLDVAWCLLVFRTLDEVHGYDFNKEYIKSIRCVKD